MKNINSDKSNKSTKLNKKEDKVVELYDGDSSGDENVSLDNTEQLMNIMEAFANDDVIGDFLQEKQEIIEKGKPKPVDLTLPGWGDWGGPGLTVSKKKRKRFTKGTGPVPKRKDDGNANVIINEKCNNKFTQHQVRRFLVLCVIYPCRTHTHALGQTHTHTRMHTLARTGTNNAHTRRRTCTRAQTTHTLAGARAHAHKQRTHSQAHAHKRVHSTFVIYIRGNFDFLL